jgi:hypothetical protein
MDPGVAALLGAVVGGLMSAAASFGFEWWADCRSRRNLSIAIAGEVAAMSEMIRRRQYLEGIRYACQAAERGEVHLFQVMLPAEILLVSRSAMKQVGLLRGALPTLVPRAVMMADAIAADLNRLMLHGIDKEESALARNDPLGAERFYVELYGILLNALTLGDKLVLEVRRQYPDVEIETALLGPLERALVEDNTKGAPVVA